MTQTAALAEPANRGIASDPDGPQSSRGTSAGNRESGQAGEGPGFLTDEESTAETLRRMRVELQLQEKSDPPASAGKATRSVQSRRAVLQFRNRTLHGHLALPIRKIRIRADDGLHVLSMRSVVAIRFQKAKPTGKVSEPDQTIAGLPAKPRTEEDTGREDPQQSPAESVPCVVEHDFGKIQGHCDIQPWKQLSLKRPSQHYRALKDHCIRNCGDQKALEEIRFPTAPVNSLGGSL